MRRRELILGAALATLTQRWSAAQPKRMPVVGALSAYPLDRFPFTQGLREAAFVESRDVAIDWRIGDGEREELPAVAADLVRRKVDAIAAFGTDEARAARRASSTIPIIFESANPVADGLVPGLARPGGNLTGVSLIDAELMPKRLELLSELLPRARRFALLVSPDAADAPATIGSTEDAARAKGIELHVLTAATLDEITAAFRAAVELHAAGLITGFDRYFDAATRLVTPESAYRIPVITASSLVTESGGLISYGPDLAASRRQMGIYVGRILKGERPADLPVVQPDKFDLAINLKTAKALGLTVPQLLLAQADEVIE